MGRNVKLKPMCTSRHAEPEIELVVVVRVALCCHSAALKAVRVPRVAGVPIPNRRSPGTQCGQVPAAVGVTMGCVFESFPSSPRWHHDEP